MGVWGGVVNAELLKKHIIESHSIKEITTCYEMAVETTVYPHPATHSLSHSHNKSQYHDSDPAWVHSDIVQCL